MKLPKLIITDIDGVWTDGGMYYGPDNSEFKKFNTRDSAGVLFCKALNIPVGIITGENSELVKRRADKLSVEYCFINVKNKKQVANELIKQLGIEFSEVAYIGDDINDLSLIKEVGIAATVSDAPDYIKKHCSFITTRKGGEGAFREFVEYIIVECGVDILSLINILHK